MYTLVISDGFLCPIWTVLSEANHSNFLCFWLKEWLRFGGRIPSEFCSDMSVALLNAGVCAFTQYSSLSEYTNALFALNLDDSVSTAPSCFIRIDIAHLIKNVAACKHFANVKPKVRETYIRCVALLLQETDFQEAQNLIKLVLIIAYSSSEGNLGKILVFLLFGLMF